MAPKGSFENQYEDFSCDDSVNNVLNKSRNGISEKFQTQLETFKKTKLRVLFTKMESDIFYDGSVYTGSAGLALYYLMSPEKKEDPSENLLNALSYLNLDQLKGRRISFLCGDAGPLAIAAVISHKLGPKCPSTLADTKILIQKLMSLISLMNDSPDELLYGKVGYLYALLFVTKYIDEKNIIPASHIEKVINSILKSGKQFSITMKSESPLLWQWHDKIYFGAAHGMSGILYSLLQARSYIHFNELRNYIKPSIDWLLKHRYPSGNFPSSLGSASGDRLVQWCHGAPGFVPLCIAAYQTFKEEQYLKYALDCGDVIWERGLCAKGYSICHGVSGNAYAFLQLYQATKNPLHLYRACCFMEWCALERPGTELHRPDRPASLFEGVIGRLYLAEEMARPMEAKFPAMCL
ncbi:lanC-like protein 2 [Pectinophora gossypiella]|uniref:LanC-like protein 2 n=1 Tax=Pectinophora gossypiella TaxID=13191 RepID=A0A1E1VYN3_PECGO|nr:lanC-like protein 2 [Pectinophora gossypiella]